MLTQQQFYNKVCHSLRTHGNQFGGYTTRNWGWVNPANPSERCAIAQFISGNTELEVMENLENELNCSISELLYQDDSLIREVIQAFDYRPEMINDKLKLEAFLSELASEYNLQYSNPVEIKTIETVS